MNMFTDLASPSKLL